MRDAAVVPKAAGRATKACRSHRDSLGSPKPALDTTSHGLWLEGIYGQAIDKSGRGRRLYETALSVFEGGRRGESFTALMVEPARDGHEHDVDAEVGRREEVAV